MGRDNRMLDVLKMNVNIISFVEALLPRVKQEPFMTLAESLMRVRCMETALELGWTIQEGSTNPGTAEILTTKDGTPHWQRRERRFELAQGSYDVCVVDPCVILFELKCRPDHGPKANAQFMEILPDVERVSLVKNSAFIFLFDPKIYRSFTGEKSSTTGRPPKGHEWFNGAFESANTRPRAGCGRKIVPFNSVDLCLGFWHVDPEASASRILVCGHRSDAEFKE